MTIQRCTWTILWNSTYNHDFLHLIYTCLFKRQQSICLFWCPGWITVVLFTYVMNFTISQLFVESPCLWLNILKSVERRKSVFLFEVFVLSPYGLCRPCRPHNSPSRRPPPPPSYAPSARWIILQLLVASIAKFNRMFTYPVNYKCNV